MSGTHARLLAGEEGWGFEDARSTNGSFVNGEQLHRAILRDGDFIELGLVIFRIRMALPTPQGTGPLLDSVQSPGREFGLATLLPVMVSQMLADLDARQVQLTADAGLALVTHNWPFNARELVQNLKRAIALTGSGIVKAHDLLIESPSGSSAKAPR